MAVNLPKALRLTGSVSVSAASETHPNKMPFSGVLTYVDRPSDMAPLGTNGRRIQLLRAAAERALPSLIHMGVGLTANLDGHNPQHKIGVITAAALQDDDDRIKIEGFVYASDFPTEAKAIQDNKGDLGFSFEAKNIFVESMDVNPAIITDLTFTGAAILLRNKAAYKTTSLSASAEKENQMTPEEMKAMFTEVVAPINQAVTQLKTDLQAMGTKVEEISKAAPAPTPGPVKVLAQADVDAAVKTAVEAAEAKVASQVADLNTKVADMQAAAAKLVPAPERKTLPPMISQLLARSGAAVGDDGKVAVGMLDKAMTEANMSTTQRLTLKTALNHSGLLT